MVLKTGASVCLRPNPFAGDHTSSDIARRGQLWVPAAVTETTGRQLPSEASPSGGGGRQKQGESSVRVRLGLVQRRFPVDGLMAEGWAWSKGSHPMEFLPSWPGQSLDPVGC